MTSSSTIVQRLWNYCNVLHDDGMSYGDDVEQLTYLLLLKMADERVRVLGKHSAIADTYGWPSLLRLDGDALEIHYRTILTELGKGSGLIPVIFRKASSGCATRHWRTAPACLARMRWRRRSCKISRPRWRNSRRLPKTLGLSRSWMSR